MLDVFRGPGLADTGLSRHEVPGASPLNMTGAGGVIGIVRGVAQNKKSGTGDGQVSRVSGVLNAAKTTCKSVEKGFTEVRQ
jgi:hypothetical protein